MVYWMVLCVNMTQDAVITEKENFLEEKQPWDTALGIYSIKDEGWDIVGGAIPGLVLLGSIRKQASK